MPPVALPHGTAALSSAIDTSIFGIFVAVIGMEIYVLWLFFFSVVRLAAWFSIVVTGRLTQIFDCGAPQNIAQSVNMVEDF